VFLEDHEKGRLKVDVNDIKGACGGPVPERWREDLDILRHDGEIAVYARRRYLS